MFAVLVAASTVFFVLRRRTRVQRRARRRLRALQHAARAGTLDPRTGTYRIAAALRAGLQRPRLCDDTLPGDSNWSRFIRALNHARYRREPPSPETLLTLAHAAPEYLKRRYP